MAGQQDRDPEHRQRRARGALSPDPLITGERVSLRAARTTDLPRWWETLSDPLQVQYGAPAFVDPPADLEPRLEASRAALEAVEPGALVIVENADPDRLLGDIAWRFDLHPRLAIADVGYAVHPDARGRGIGAAALALLVRWLMLDEGGPGLARVQLDHSVENPASCRVAVTAGLAPEGTRKAFLPLRDDTAPAGVRRHDVCLHGVVSPLART